MNELFSNFVVHVQVYVVCAMDIRGAWRWEGGEMQSGSQHGETGSQQGLEEWVGRNSRGGRGEESYLGEERDRVVKAHKP